MSEQEKVIANQPKVDDNDKELMETEEIMESVEPAQESEVGEKEKPKSTKSTANTNKRRFSASISTFDERTIKVLSAELGLDDSKTSVLEKNGELMSLMLRVMEAELEMARLSTGKRYINESTLKNYLEQKYREAVSNMAPAPLFDLKE